MKDPTKASLVVNVGNKCCCCIVWGVAFWQHRGDHREGPLQGELNLGSDAFPGVSTFRWCLLCYHTSGPVRVSPCNCCQLVSPFTSCPCTFLPLQDVLLEVYAPWCGHCKVRAADISESCAGPAALRCAVLLHPTICFVPLCLLRALHSICPSSPVC